MGRCENHAEAVHEQNKGRLRSGRSGKHAPYSCTTTFSALVFQLFAISEAEVSFKQARSASKAKQWDTCTEKATKTLETSTHNVELRHLRLDCALQKGDIEQAVADLT